MISLLKTMISRARENSEVVIFDAGGKLPASHPPCNDLHFLPTVRHRGHRLAGVEQVVALSHPGLSTAPKIGKNHGKTHVNYPLVNYQ